MGDGVVASEMPRWRGETQVESDTRQDSAFTRKVKQLSRAVKPRLQANEQSIGEFGHVDTHLVQSRHLQCAEKVDADGQCGLTEGSTSAWGRHFQPFN